MSCIFSMNVYMISMIDTFAKSHKVVWHNNDRHIHKEGEENETRTWIAFIHTLAFPSQSL